MNLIDDSMAGVSVIMPVYNGVQTIERSVRSVVAQDYHSWELLIIDDGSTDGSRERALELSRGDRRIKVLRTAENLGPSAARNEGLRRAEGRMVAYLDCDDEFYPNYLGRVDHFGRIGEVLVFGYDYVDDGDQGTERRIETYDPTGNRQLLFMQNIATPLGIAHRRAMATEVGGFDIDLWCLEDWEFWKRLARLGAEFLYLPYRSGLYHIQEGSRSRAPRATARQQATYETRRLSSISIYAAPQHLGGRENRRIAFGSSYSYFDATSAAHAAADTMHGLTEVGYSCQAFCASKMSGPWEHDHDRFVAESGVPYHYRDSVIDSHSARLTYARDGRIPVTIAKTGSTRQDCFSPRETADLMAFYEKFLETFQPDVLITYFDDPIGDFMVDLAKRRDIITVFLLDDFFCDEIGVFRNIDYCFTHSQSLARYFWEFQKLMCSGLPIVVNRDRVIAKPRRGRCVTFVEPTPANGTVVFAHIARRLADRRPDIPVQIVGNLSLRDLGELSGTGNATWTKQNCQFLPPWTAPVKHFGATKLLLLPSLSDHTLGYAAAEAMVNGIPVICSNRGALPELVGDAGFVLDVPSAAEVDPWVDTIVRLWDDTTLYSQMSNRSLSRSTEWNISYNYYKYNDIFRLLTQQPGPPLMPHVTPS